MVIRVTHTGQVLMWPTSKAAGHLHIHASLLPCLGHISHRTLERGLGCKEKSKKDGRLSIPTKLFIDK